MTVTTTSSTWASLTTAFDHAVAFVRQDRGPRVVGRPHVALLALMVRSDGASGRDAGRGVTGPGWRS